MDVSPRSPAGGTDANESVGDSWVIPSSSGHLIPRRHNSDQASAVVKPAPGTRSVPKGGGIQRYFKPKSKANDHVFNRMPDPVGSASPAQQSGRLIKQRSSTADVKSRRRRSAKLLVSQQPVSVEEPQELRQQSARTPARSPNQKASEKALKERRRRTAALLLSSQDSPVATEQDTSVGDSIRSEPRSSESSDGDDSFIASDDGSPVATAQLGYNYLDTCTAIPIDLSGIESVVNPRETEFLETVTVYPIDNGVGAYAKHKERPWDSRNSYRIVRGGVAGMRRVQSATATGTFMRILDNCTFEFDAAISITKEIHEMQLGARMSESQTTTALQKLAKQNPEKPHQERKALVFTNGSTL